MGNRRARNQCTARHMHHHAMSPSKLHRLLPAAGRQVRVQQVRQRDGALLPCVPGGALRPGPRRRARRHGRGDLAVPALLRGGASGRGEDLTLVSSVRWIPRSNQRRASSSTSETSMAPYALRFTAGELCACFAYNAALDLPPDMHTRAGPAQGWICNSSICMTRRGLMPTGIAIFKAQVRTGCGKHWHIWMHEDMLWMHGAERSCFILSRC